ncbi:hypothetical protein L1887_23439 [Cichorium endivia]|nr:hypothetical protein L1887_23439 [Cichorium endivia]
MHEVDRRFVAFVQVHGSCSKPVLGVNVHVQTRLEDAFMTLLQIVGVPVSVAVPSPDIVVVPSPILNDGVLEGRAMRSSLVTPLHTRFFKDDRAGTKQKKMLLRQLLYIISHPDSEVVVCGDFSVVVDISEMILKKMVDDIDDRDGGTELTTEEKKTRLSALKEFRDLEHITNMDLAQKDKIQWGIKGE